MPKVVHIPTPAGARVLSGGFNVNRSSGPTPKGAMDQAGLAEHSLSARVDFILIL